MKSDLNLYVVQYYPSELTFALPKLKSDMNVLYSNCISTLNIGNQIIETDQFDTVLYNKDNNILILLMKNGYVTKKDLFKYLELNKKDYSEVIFSSNFDEYVETDNIIDISLVNKKYILDGELKDALSKGIKSCEFYPNIVATLGLGYLTNTNEKINLYEIPIESLIRLDDRVMLVINQNSYDEKNIIDKNQVFNIIKNNGFNCDIILDKRPNLSEEKFIKMLKK